MTGAGNTPGGIAAVNRNILPVLVRLASERQCSLTVLSFLERNSARPPSLPGWVKFRGFAGNKLRLAAALVKHAMTRPILFFDHVTLALPVLPFSRIGWVKTILFAHGSESWRRIRRTSGWLFQCATLCLANSQFTLSKMRERLSRFNGVACPLGLAPEFKLNQAVPSAAALPAMRDANGEAHSLGSHVLLLVGRMHPAEREKGHHQLLEVWPEIRREFPDAQLVFAGPGDDRENIAQLARSRGIGNSVFLPGPLSVDDLQQLYAGCYAFTMPSKQEGFGLVFLEAMNCAKPCVGCFDDGAEDVIAHEQTGLLIRNQNDPTALAGALRRLLGDPELAQQMGRRGFERLHAHFTAAHLQQRIYDQVASVLK